jgi:hypothetical protein
MRYLPAKSHLIEQELIKLKESRSQSFLNKMLERIEPPL